MPFYYDQRYTTVAEERNRARRQVLKMQKSGYKPQNIEAFKGRLASSFWTQAWISNFEALCYDSNRLARGRRYLHNGLICDMATENGKVTAQVLGSRLYQVNLNIKPLATGELKLLREEFAKNTAASLDLMIGSFTPEVMKIACNHKFGLLPSMDQLSVKCNCPDFVPLCKHILAVLYGLATIMDRDPGFLFGLRSVNPKDLLPDVLLPHFGAQSQLPPAQLSTIFGVDIDLSESVPDSQAEKEIKEAKPAAADAAIPDSSKVSQAANIPIEPPFDFMNPSGEAIRKLREMAGMDRWEMAKKIKASVDSLERWETSETPNMLYDSKVKIWNFQKNLMRRLAKTKG